MRRSLAAGVWGQIGLGNCWLARALPGSSSLMVGCAEPQTSQVDERPCSRVSERRSKRRWCRNACLVRCCAEAKLLQRGSTQLSQAPHPPALFLVLLGCARPDRGPIWRCKIARQPEGYQGDPPVDRTGNG
ncbi:hypothetical protein L209DRAFT_751211 [Thermothelomyces heterothallicus CBS 203.75]